MAPSDNHGEPSAIDPSRNEPSSTPTTPLTHDGRARGDSAASSVSRMVRRMSNRFEESHPPGGFMAATGEFASSLVSSRDATKLNAPAPSNSSPSSPLIPHGAVTENGLQTSSERNTSKAADHETIRQEGAGSSPRKGPATSSDDVTISVSTDASKAKTPTAPFDNGYHFPPKYNWKESTAHGLRASWEYFTTPLGFCVVVYGLNVVAWGGMLFLLLCNASPAMCYPTCNDINSPRRKWIEWDSQIINALFCVTGFGLAPWRFRDWYYLLQFRILKKEEGLRRLAGFHRGWFRLPGSQGLPLQAGPQNPPLDAPRSSVPYPESRIPEAPLTGVRAPATPTWRMDFVVWSMVCNTFLQAVLSGFMWGMNRYKRPSWSTGLFVALACIVAAMGGIMMFVEGKKVKSIEGVPLTGRDLERLARDRELGIPHYNNIKDKKPKEKVTDPESNIEKAGSRRSPQ
ncbi:hypothetical protein QBC33DRAFT_576991 [Phialemonium atrogriseum]|uniref:Uncharacterized protein n=1 Tax=Phialemonium atrogriseum TaxID=1093897 RepID=A0AAJ0FNE1_9PEZI|nr:uncharacterized protein QBC33DRAFT_576991 [Phialemonium atrogriseum]KAK1769198.1 hypothetical protein QBC33DRAFT_576991 [Phialemonium atrogriseum]